jgi:tetratricopeptide (TPR) repeat protein
MLMQANLLRIIIFSFLSIILISNSTFAETKTFVKEYNYQASEVDSKLTSRSVALAQVKRLLLEELGTFLISESTVKNFELTKDQISSLTAGVVITVIIDEKWDGKTYYLKAKITTDTDELAKSIDNVRKNQEQNKSLEEVRAKTEEALKRIEQLKKEMETGKGSKAGKEKYTKAVNELSSIDWFRKGLALRNIEKNNREAMKAFDTAIEVDPEMPRLMPEEPPFITIGGSIKKPSKKVNWRLNMIRN